MMREHATSNGMRTILSGLADKTGARRGHVRPINYVDCDMSSELTMYTTSWCGYCARLKKVLKAEGIAFDEVDIEADPAAAQFVASANGGNQTVPTLKFPDGTTLTNPSGAEVKKKLSR
jgi:mycoredoxin